MIEVATTLGRRACRRRVHGATGNRAHRASRLRPAFGEIISETGTWPDEVPFGYQSNWLYLTDTPEGHPLYLPPARAPYHAGIGRFLQRDPLQRPGENAYVYARNDPVNLVDPAGMRSINFPNTGDAGGREGEDEGCPWNLKQFDDLELLTMFIEIMAEAMKHGQGTEEFDAAISDLGRIANEFGHRGRNYPEGMNPAPVAEEDLRGMVEQVANQGYWLYYHRDKGKAARGLEESLKGMIQHARRMNKKRSRKDRAAFKQRIKRLDRAVGRMAWLNDRRQWKAWEARVRARRAERRAARRERREEQLARRKEQRLRRYGRKEALRGDVLPVGEGTEPAEVPAEVTGEQSARGPAKLPRWTGGRKFRKWVEGMIEHGPETHISTEEGWHFYGLRPSTEPGEWEPYVGGRWIGAEREEGESLIDWGLRGTEFGFGMGVRWK